MTQDHSQHPRPTLLAARIRDISARAEVNLSFLARFGLDTPKRQRRLRFQLPDKPPHTVVAAAKAMIGLQILMNPRRRQALLQLRDDPFAIRLALTWRTTALRWVLVKRRGNEVRYTIVLVIGRRSLPLQTVRLPICCYHRLLGTVRIQRPDMLVDRPPIDAKRLRDPTIGITGFVE